MTRSSPPKAIPVPTSVKLFHISTDTLEDQRTVNDELSLGIPFGGGSVHASHLEFVGQGLVVHGRKTDPITSGTPEVGSGHFLRGTTPPSILASQSPTTKLGAEELHAIASVVAY